jgi:hypothetical protein
MTISQEKNMLQTMNCIHESKQTQPDHLTSSCCLLACIFFHKKYLYYNFVFHLFQSRVNIIILSDLYPQYTITINNEHLIKQTTGGLA